METELGIRDDVLFHFVAIHRPAQKLLQGSDAAIGDSAQTRVLLPESVPSTRE